MVHAMHITPFAASSGAAPFGAEIGGVDWRLPLDEPAREALYAAFLEHQLLCLRASPLTPAEFARVAAYFGELQVQLIRRERQAEAQAVSMLESTYARPEDKPGDLGLVRLEGWHTDDSYFAVPAKATVLQGLAIPSRGGQTRFASAAIAYDELPEALRRQADGRRAVHGYDTQRARARAAKLTAEEAAETGEVEHPLIRTHDETGRRAIYFNSNRTDRVVGLARADSDALLDALHRHMTQPKYQYHHQWRVGDILVWDNRSLIHSVNMDFPVGERRLHQRALVKGTAPA